MALPKAIQDQMDRVEQMEREAAESAAGQTKTEQPTEEITETAEPVVPAVADQPAVVVDKEDWRQKFLTLQGMYKADLAREVQQANAASDAKIQRLSDQLEVMSRKITESETAQQREVTTKDDDVFGEDLVSMVRRIASAEVQRGSSTIIGEVEKRVNPLREQVGQVSKAQSASTEDRFWGRLNENVPDWETVNGDANWHKWLAEFDPVAGTTRQEALDNAQSKLDAGRVAALFNLFKAQNPAYTKPADAAQPSRAQQELSRQVTPPKTKANAPAPQGDKTWTQAQYLAAMDPRQQASIGHEAWVRLQDEADRAFQEGRVRG